MRHFVVSSDKQRNNAHKIENTEILSLLLVERSISLSIDFEKITSTMTEATVTADHTLFDEMSEDIVPETKHGPGIGTKYLKKTKPRKFTEAGLCKFLLSIALPLTWNIHWQNCLSFWLIWGILRLRIFRSSEFHLI